MANESKAVADVDEETRRAVQAAAEKVVLLSKTVDKLSGPGLEKTVSKFRARCAKNLKAALEELPNAIEELTKLKALAKK